MLFPISQPHRFFNHTKYLNHTDLFTDLQTIPICKFLNHTDIFQIQFLNHTGVHLTSILF